MVASAPTPGRPPARRPVALGMVTYNGERHVRQAIDSLLTQTWPDFTLTIVDDASTDRTPQIIAHYAARDPRIKVVRNPQRLGYIGNSVAAFREAPADAELFAWVSDHDVHAPRWLEALITALAAHSDAILAYPVTVRISDTGERLPVPAPRFATCGLSRRAGALAVARSGIGFGNMIYGLFRTSALRTGGVLRRVLLPDAVLITEIARLGCIVQVPEELWYRRYVDLTSLPRQRRNLFARRPWWVALPPGLVNPLVLLWHLTLKPTAGPLPDRTDGVRIAARVAWRRCLHTAVVTVRPYLRTEGRAARALRVVYDRLAR